MSRRPFLFIAVVLIAGWACSLDVFRDSSPLSFAIREGDYVDAPPPPQIVLLLATETQFPCSNYRLESSLDTAGGTLYVAVSDRVRKPAVCTDMIGPAMFKVALPVTLGTYSLEFTRDGVTDRYSVTVTDSTMEIATIEAHFTHPTAQQFPRAS